jgi:hypothetical protein
MTNRRGFNNHSLAERKDRGLSIVVWEEKRMALHSGGGTGIFSSIVE